MEEFMIVDTRGLWLADDERSWTLDFNSAAVFTDKELAEEIRLRETVLETQTTYVMQLH